MAHRLHRDAVVGEWLAHSHEDDMSEALAPAVELRRRPHRLLEHLAYRQVA